MYEPTEWKDHIVKHPRRFKMENGEAPGLVYLTPAPGEVDQQGTPQNAQNFNHMEEGIRAVSEILEQITADTPEALNTFTKIAAEFEKKVDVEKGKSLSANDYTDADKTKLDGIATGATQNTASSTTPKAAGTATAGSETGYARGDHVHPLQTDVTGNAGTATKLSAAHNINGMSFDGSADRINYGVCSTAAATAAKAVSCPGFAAGVGAEITVFFSATNTAANPTLNVNDTGKKPIYYRGAAIAAGNLAAGRIYTFRCTGDAYSLVGDLNTNTTYADMTAASASAAGKAGLVPAPAAGAQAKYLRGDGTWQTPPDTNTTYAAATTTAAGLMSAADKGKLDAMSLPVCYQGSVSNGGTVTKSLPAGKTKCLIIAWWPGSSGIDCGSYILTGLAAKMTAVTTAAPLIASGGPVLLYTVTATGAVTLHTTSNASWQYTMIYFA